MSKKNGGFNNFGNTNGPSNGNSIGISNVVFNTMGLEPVSCKFTFTRKVIEEQILELADKMLLDAKDAKVAFFPAEKELFSKFDDKRGNPHDAYLWIRSTSADVCDKTLTETSDSAVKVNTVSYSDELRKFMDIFAVSLRENGKDIGPKLIPEKYSKDYKGIQIDLKKLFAVLFDVNGTEFAKVNNSSAVRTDIIVHSVLDSKGDLVAFSVIKQVPDKHNKRNLVPQKIKKF